MNWKDRRIGRVYNDSQSIWHVIMICQIDIILLAFLASTSNSVYEIVHVSFPKWIMKQKVIIWLIDFLIRERQWMLMNRHFECLLKWSCFWAYLHLHLQIIIFFSKFSMNFSCYHECVAQRRFSIIIIIIKWCSVQ